MASRLRPLSLPALALGLAITLAAPRLTAQDPSNSRTGTTQNEAPSEAVLETCEKLEACLERFGAAAGSTSKTIQNLHTARKQFDAARGKDRSAARRNLQSHTFQVRDKSLELTRLVNTELLPLQQQLIQERIHKAMPKQRELVELVEAAKNTAQGIAFRAGKLEADLIDALIGQAETDGRETLRRLQSINDALAEARQNLQGGSQSRPRG